MLYLCTRNRKLSSNEEVIPRFLHICRFCSLCGRNAGFPDPSGVGGGFAQLAPVCLLPQQPRPSRVRRCAAAYYGCLAYRQPLRHGGLCVDTDPDDTGLPDRRAVQPLSDSQEQQRRVRSRSNDFVDFHFCRRQHGYYCLRLAFPGRDIRLFRAVQSILQLLVLPRGLPARFHHLPFGLSQARGSRTHVLGPLAAFCYGPQKNSQRSTGDHP